MNVSSFFYFLVSVSTNLIVLSNSFIKLFSGFLEGLLLR